MTGPADPHGALPDEYIRPRATAADLTPRQLAVASLIAKATPYKRIQWELGIARSTLRDHVTALVYLTHSDPSKDVRVQIARWWWEQMPEHTHGAA